MQGLAAQIKVLRYISLFKEPIKEVDLHVFTDARSNRVSAVLYAVIHQNSGTNQEPLCSKSRISKSNLKYYPRKHLFRWICWICVKGVFKRSSLSIFLPSQKLSRHLQDVFARRLEEDVLQTHLKDFFKTSLKMNNSHTHLVFRTPSSHIGR